MRMSGRWVRTTLARWSKSVEVARVQSSVVLLASLGRKTLRPSYLVAYITTHFLFSSRMVVRDPTCVSYLSVGPWLTRNTISWLSMAFPNLAARMIPEFPTRAHVPNGGSCSSLRQEPSSAPPGHRGR